MNLFITNKELVDKVSADLFKESRNIESHKSWFVIRNYLEQLDIEQRKSMLKKQYRKNC